MLRFLLPILLIFTFPTWALSQVQAKGDAPLLRVGDRASIRVWTANDLYYLPLKTDKYYSAGAGLLYTRYLWDAGGSVTSSRSWSVRQDIFTPEDIVTKTLMVNDRPFASYAVAEHLRQNYRPDGWRFSHQYTVGVLGKYSGGGLAQNTIHRLVPFADELAGWENEVKSDLILNYRGAVRRRYQLFPRLSLAGGAAGRLGTLFTDLGATLGGNWTVIEGAKRCSLYLGVDVELRWVGYNATLTGGLFNRDGRFRDAIQIERWARTTRASAQLRIGRFSVEGSANYQSPEFKGGGHHVFGVVGVGVYW